MCCQSWLLLCTPSCSLNHQLLQVFLSARPEFLRQNMVGSSALYCACVYSLELCRLIWSLSHPLHNQCASDSLVDDGHNECSCEYSECSCENSECLMRRWDATQERDGSGWMSSWGVGGLPLLWWRLLLGMMADSWPQLSPLCSKLSLQCCRLAHHRVTAFLTGTIRGLPTRALLSSYTRPQCRPKTHGAQCHIWVIPKP